MKFKSIAFDRRLLTILLIVFVQMIGASMVHPILPLYAQSEFNMAPEAITLLLTAFFGAQFLAGPFIGRLSDRRGRLPVLIVSQIGTVIAFLMIGLAQSVAQLFFARLLDGVTGGNIVVALAYVTDIMPEGKRTQALGYVMAAFGLGFVVGPALGGVLASFFGPQTPFLFAAAAALVTVALTGLTLEETLSAAQQARNRNDMRARLSPAALASNVPLVAVLIVTFVGRFGFGLLIGTFALFAEKVLFAGYDFADVTLRVGLLLMLVGIGQFFTQIVLLPAALRRFDDPAIVLAGGGIAGFGAVHPGGIHPAHVRRAEHDSLRHRQRFADAGAAIPGDQNCAGGAARGDAGRASIGDEPGCDLVDGGLGRALCPGPDPA